MQQLVVQLQDPDWKKIILIPVNMTTTLATHIYRIKKY